MKTFDLKDNEGRLYAFEISSGIGRRHVSKIVEKIPGTTVTRTKSKFLWNPIVPNRDDTVCYFEFCGIKFQVWEA